MAINITVIEDKVSFITSDGYAHKYPSMAKREEFQILSGRDPRPTGTSDELYQWINDNWAELKHIMDFPVQI